MSQENETKLKKVFVKPEFQKLLMPEAEKQRALLVAYLKQEGLFDDTQYAIVDLEASNPSTLMNFMEKSL